MELDLNKKASELTLDAEEYGNDIHSRLQNLLDLLAHESALVREGAVIGLRQALYQFTDIVDIVEHVAQTDASPGVQMSAQECLESLGFSVDDAAYVNYDDDFEDN